MTKEPGNFLIWNGEGYTSVKKLPPKNTGLFYHSIAWEITCENCDFKQSGTVNSMDRNQNDAESGGKEFAQKHVEAIKTLQEYACATGGKLPELFTEKQTVFPQETETKHYEI